MSVVFTRGAVGKERTIVGAGNAGHLAVGNGYTAREGTRVDLERKSTGQRPDASQHSLSRVSIMRDKHFPSAEEGQLLSLEMASSANEMRALRICSNTPLLAILHF